MHTRGQTRRDDDHVDPFDCLRCGRVFSRGSASTRAALLVLFGLVLLAKHSIVLISIENVHLPQHALLAILLARGGPKPAAAWLAATALEVLDGGYQYLFLRDGRPDPLGWNDVTLNAMGAALGVMALMHLGLRRARAPAHSWQMIVAMLAPLTAAALFITQDSRRSTA